MFYNNVFQYSLSIIINITFEYMKYHIKNMFYFLKSFLFSNKTYIINISILLFLNSIIRRKK